MQHNLSTFQRVKKYCCSGSACFAFSAIFLYQSKFDDLSEEAGEGISGRPPTQKMPKLAAYYVLRIEKSKKGAHIRSTLGVTFGRQQSCKEPIKARSGSM